MTGNLIAQRNDHSTRLVILFGILARQLIGDDVHFRTRLFKTHARFQFRYAIKEQVISGKVSGITNIQRCPDLCAAERKKKSAGMTPMTLKKSLSRRTLFPRYPACRENRLPQLVTQNDRARRTGLRVGLIKRTTISGSRPRIEKSSGVTLEPSSLRGSPLLIKFAAMPE